MRLLHKVARAAVIHNKCAMKLTMTMIQLQKRLTHYKSVYRLISSNDKRLTIPSSPCNHHRLDQKQWNIVHLRVCSLIKDLYSRRLAPHLITERTILLWTLFQDNITCKIYLLKVKARPCPCSNHKTLAVRAELTKNRLCHERVDVLLQQGKAW